MSRAVALDGELRAITVTDALCLGECFGADETAEPGCTNSCRIELAMADGSGLSYGPHALTISAQLTRRAAIGIAPNPVRHGARIEVLLAGRAGVPDVEARVAIYDLQGRERRVLHRGTLARGVTTLNRTAATPRAGRCPRACTCRGSVPRSAAPSRETFGSADPDRATRPRRKAPDKDSSTRDRTESRFSCGSPVLEFFASLPRDRTPIPTSLRRPPRTWAFRTTPWATRQGGREAP